MKKLLKLLLLAVAVVLVVWLISFTTKGNLAGVLDSYLYYSYCDNPVTYKIGRVDSAFNISPEKFKQEVQVASTSWNSAYGKFLIVYDAQSSFSVNLIYDERQRSLTQLYQAKEKVEKELAVVEVSLKDYETNATELDAKVNQLNKEISAWNRKGGAPEKEYKRLGQEVEKVNSEIAQLAQQKQEADEKVLHYNDLIDQYNLQVAQYADLLKNLPEEGLYDPLTHKIDIYFYDSTEQFLHTATHEFGHAIGLAHAQDEASIMYPIANASNQFSKEDLDMLNNYCQRRSVVEELVERGRDIIHNVVAEK